MIKLKDDVAFESLNKYATWTDRNVILSSKYPCPLVLQWYSHWEWNRGCDFIEINKGTREIRCQGCEDILFEMIKDGLIEKVSTWPYKYKYICQQEENNE